MLCVRDITSCFFIEQAVQHQTCYHIWSLDIFLIENEAFGPDIHRCCHYLGPEVRSFVLLTVLSIGVRAPGKWLHFQGSDMAIVEYLMRLAKEMS